jgi:hypothetical protein
MHPGRLIYAVITTSALVDKIFSGISHALSLFISFIHSLIKFMKFHNHDTAAKNGPTA